MGRNYLAKPAGDAVNALLAAVGYNFRLLLARLAVLLRWFFARTGRSSSLAMSRSLRTARQARVENMAQRISETPG